MTNWNDEFLETYAKLYRKYTSPIHWKEQIKNFDVGKAPEFLLDFKHVLDKHNLKFWLIWGTALGAFRDGRIIPYDHDMDTAILYDDRRKLLDCTPDLIKAGITPWTIGVQPDGLWFRFGQGKCFIDVVLFRKIGDEYRCMKWGMEPQWVETEKRISFLGEAFLIPSEPEKYLESKYGIDWRTPTETSHCTS